MHNNGSREIVQQQLLKKPQNSAHELKIIATRNSDSLEINVNEDLSMRIQRVKTYD
jgi:hypothetical protein